MALAIAAQMLAGGSLAAQGEGPLIAAPHEVKAAFLVKFLGYTEWPQTSFERTDSPLRIVVLGDPDVAAALEEVARRQPGIHGHPLEISYHRLPNRALREGDPQIEAARQAHAVYVEGDDPERAARLLGLLGRDDVLTIGAHAEFCVSGGMIALREQGRRIVFDANASAIRESSLQVSARVLQLARVVSPGSS